MGAEWNIPARIIRIEGFQQPQVSGRDQVFYVNVDRCPMAHADGNLFDEGGVGQKILVAHP